MIINLWVQQRQGIFQQSKIHRLFKKALETELEDGNYVDMCS